MKYQNDVHINIKQKDTWICMSLYMNLCVVCECMHIFEVCKGDKNNPCGKQNGRTHMYKDNSRKRKEETYFSESRGMGPV